MGGKRFFQENAALLALVNEALRRHRCGIEEPVRDPGTGEAFTVWKSREIGVMTVSRGHRVVWRLKFKPPS